MRFMSLRGVNFSDIRVRYLVIEARYRLRDIVTKMEKDIPRWNSHEERIADGRLTKQICVE